MSRRAGNVTANGSSAAPAIRAAEAVEVLMQAAVHGEPLPRGVDRAALFGAAVRQAMRLTVLLFAEARRLLPVHNDLYQESYCLEALADELAQALRTDPDALARRRNAWPRIAALTRLVRDGSPHPQLPVRAYGGDLFAPGDPAGDTPAERALAMFDRPARTPDDLTVARVLVFMTRDRSGRRVRYDRLSTRVVGTLYESLLAWRPALTGRGAAGDAGDGEWRLSRAPEARKGQGTFYTPQAVADPLVAEVLRPLCYADGHPLPPERILSLRILDPAMGSGSFLVSALRFLSTAVQEALACHGRLVPAATVASPTPTATLVHLLPGYTFELPLPPGHKERDRLLAAHVRRHVVERCLHGVDLDPLAVELARIALWLETMDWRLPFAFLEHKLKVGNSLLGTRLADLAVYPTAAAREPNAAAVRPAASPVYAEMRAVLADLRSPRLPFLARSGARQLQRRTASLLDEVHAVPIELPDRKRALYQDGFIRSRSVARLRRLLDRWCALWFWPAGSREPRPGPAAYYADDEAGMEMAGRVAERRGFFHWELEFPDVFSRECPGFDAVVGNPPWDVVKPSRRAAGASACAGGAESSLAMPEQWHRPEEETRAFSWFVRNAWRPAGRFDSSLRALLRAEMDARPFRHQGGGDLNLYKLFVEQAVFLSRRQGRIGLVLPAGIYADRGTADLRRMLLATCRVEWIVGFSNRNRIFQIHPRFKFALLVAQEGGGTDRLKTRFNLARPEEWQAGPARLVSRREIEQSRPEDLALAEADAGDDWRLLSLLRQRGQRVGDHDSPWQITYRRELDMSGTSGRFVPRGTLEAQGFAPDALDRWVRGEGPAPQDIALPLYQGVMLGQHDPAARGWHDQGSTTARGGWLPLPNEAKRILPRHLVPAGSWTSRGDCPAGLKVALRRITNATNERTLIAALVPDLPCGDKAAVLTAPDLLRTLALPALLNSFTLDFVARCTCAGTNFDRHHLAALPLPDPAAPGILSHLPLLSLRLGGLHPRFDPAWNALAAHYPHLRSRAGSAWPAVDPTERRAIRAAIEAIVAHAFGLAADDLARILADCGHPADRLADPAFTRTLNPRGFWRVDRSLPPDQRLPALALRARQTLAEDGLPDVTTFPPGGKEAPGLCENSR